jgi:hypothetical protein
MKEYVGKTYTFDDGATLTVLQIKQRDDGPWLTYETKRGPSFPQRLVMAESEFVKTFGHLFRDK